MVQRQTSLFFTLVRVPFYLFVAWFLGFLLFMVRLPSPVPSTSLSADAVVVLTGGPGRLEAGADLLTGKHAKKMLVSGVHKDVLARELRALTGAEKALFDCCITLDYAASNTLENAVEAAKWVEENTITSLILVTSDYHIQRSAVLFRKSMPTVAVYPYPIKSRMRPFNLAKEYNKYLATLVLELVGY